MQNESGYGARYTSAKCGEGAPDDLIVGQPKTAYTYNLLWSLPGLAAGSLVRVCVCSCKLGDCCTESSNPLPSNPRPNSATEGGRKTRFRRIW